jgi:low affinity Fe/Cu permease
MSKYISVFFLTLIAGVVLYFVFGNLFDGGDYAETAIYTFGTIIVILLSFLISLMYYAINLLKRKI